MDRSDTTEEPGRGRTASSHRSWLALAILLTAAVGLALAAFGRQYVNDMLPDERPAAATTTEAPLRVVVTRTAGGPGEWIAYQRVLAHLSDRLGRRFETRFVEKEEMAPQAVKEGADIAFVCAHTYLTLEKQGVVKGVATSKVRGRTTTVQMLVVDARSPFKTLGDLRGARLGASDKSSLGGYAYLSLIGLQNGFDPEKYFGEVQTGDTQEHYLGDVLAGKLDATVVSRAQTSPKNLSRLRVVMQSPEVGLPPVVVSASMDASLSARVRDILLSPELRSVLRSGALEGFAPLKRQDYAFAEELSNACTLKEHR